MIQADVKSQLDAQTRLGAAQGEPTGVQKAAASPLTYAAVVTAIYLLRKQIFRPGILFFAAGFVAAKRLKTDHLMRVSRSLQGLVEEQATMTINKPADELYKLWQDVEKAPSYQESMRSVTRTGELTSHWTMDLPSGQQLEWDAEWTAQEEGKRLAWRTVGDPVVPNAGQVLFEPAVSGRGTIVRVNQQFLLPGGKVAAALGGLFSRTPGGFVKENLRHFKQLAEAGEIATTRGQAHGTRGFASPLQQAVTGDREQQATVPHTGGIDHATAPQEVAQ